MSDIQHDRYVKLLSEFYDGRLKLRDYQELTELHKLNIARVGMIVTSDKEAVK